MVSGTMNEIQVSFFDAVPKAGYIKLLAVQGNQFTAESLGFEESSVLAQFLKKSSQYAAKDLKYLLEKGGDCLEAALKASAMEGYPLQIKLMQWPVAIGLAGIELGKDFIRRGVTSAKIYVTPQLHSVDVKKPKEKLVHESSIVKALLDGIDYVLNTSNAKVQVVFCMVPGNEKANVRTLLLARKFVSRGVTVSLKGLDTEEQEVLMKMAMNVPFSID